MNVPFLFGGTGWYLAANKNPYNSTRLGNLLPGTQWTKLRTPFAMDSELYVGNHFDHIRLPIDPRCFFAGTDGALPTSGGTNYSACVANMDALITQCERAKAATLAVIIDLHPTWVNSHHYTRVVDLWDADPDYNDITFQTSYGGPWKYDLVTYDPNISNWDTHPLVKFWNDFLTLFCARYNSVVEHDPDWGQVYLEIMNEPDVDFDSSDFQGYTSFHQFQVDKAAQWKTVQKHVIQKIQSIDSDAWVIATTANSDPRDLAGWKPEKWTLTGDPQYSAFGGQYTSSGDSISDPDKIIYNLHLYFPVRFTDYKRFTYLTSHDGHQQFDNIDDPNYYKDRDFLATGTYDPEGVLYPADDLDVGGWYNDDCIEELVAKVASWRSNGNNLAPIMFTELGSMTRFHIYQAPPDDNDMNNPAFSGGDDTSIYRGRWIYDVRKRMKQLGFGFSVWDYCGEFRIWDRYTTLWDDNDFSSNGAQGVLLPYLRDGLFGIDRP